MKNSKMYLYENAYLKKGFKYIAGVDEAGRGAWAGPLVVASVILKPGYINDEINDSKVLSNKKRLELFEVIRRDALAYQIEFLSSDVIDQLNIKEATIEAMKKSITSLKIRPEITLIDAEKITLNKIITKSIIKGDASSISIAAASILAKVARDQYMQEISKKYPLYYFDKHKGYGTVLHLKKLQLYGPIKGFHRFSFKPIKNVLNVKKANKKNI